MTFDQLLLASILLIRYASDENTREMRIRIVHEPSVADVDGIDLTRLRVGREYDLGSTLASMLLVEGWAEPVPFDAAPASVPFGPDDPFTMRIIGRRQPPTLVRDEFPSSARRHPAADIRRPGKKRRRR